MVGLLLDVRIRCCVVRLAIVPKGDFRLDIVPETTLTVRIRLLVVAVDV